VKDANRVSGNSATTCPFCNELDDILCTRAASTPAVLLKSASDGSVVQPLQEGLQGDSPQRNGMNQHHTLAVPETTWQLSMPPPHREREQS